MIAYGADLDEIWRRAAVFVDKILKGTRPAEFDLVLNLKTARPLGLTVPPSLLAWVDQIIQ